MPFCRGRTAEKLRGIYRCGEAEHSTCPSSEFSPSSPRGAVPRVTRGKQTKEGSADWAAPHPELAEPLQAEQEEGSPSHEVLIYMSLPRMPSRASDSC